MSPLNGDSRLKVSSGRDHRGFVPISGVGRGNHQTIVLNWRSVVAEPDGFGSGRVESLGFKRRTYGVIFNLYQ